MMFHNRFFIWREERFKKKKKIGKSITHEKKKKILPLPPPPPAPSKSTSWSLLLPLFVELWTSLFSSSSSSSWLEVSVSASLLLLLLRPHAARLSRTAALALRPGAVQGHLHRRRRPS